MAIACKYCIMTKGLKGSDIATLPKTEEEFLEHIESEHNIAVRREGETDEQAKQRLFAKHPEARDPSTCKCPSCKARRTELGHLNN
jgi:hypothetical protein